MTDRKAWWRAAVENPKAIGDTLKMTTTPEEGYYRRQIVKGGQWLPVSIWWDEKLGAWQAARGQSHDYRNVPADAEWEWAREHPISEEEYWRVFDGGEWADVNPVVHGQRLPPRPKASTSDEAARPNADNRTEDQMLADDISELKSEVRKFKEVKTDEQAAEAQSVRSRLLELGGKADKLREAAKKPFLEGGRKVDKLWQPIVKEAAELAGALRSSLAAYETAKLVAQRQAEAAAAKIREENEKAQREAETGFFPEDAPAPAAVPETPAALETTIKGSYGRAASVQMKVVVDAITDQDALYNWPLIHDRAELKECLLDLARRAHKAGHQVPGISTKEVADIR